MAAVLKKRALAEYNQNFPETQPPTKKLHLAKKPLIGSSAAAFVGLLEKCKTSNDALQLLLRISDSLQFQENDIEEALKKLSEHFQSEEESAVRVKILSLFCDIGLECPGANLNNIMELTISLLKNETSHKVIAQGMATLTKLGNKFLDDRIVSSKLVNVARDYLKDTSHQVKCRCLQLISELYPIYPESERNTESMAEAEIVLKLLSDYTHSEDARVRCEAFQSLITLHERGLPLAVGLYTQACTALGDDYEIVRHVALKVVWLIGNKYPENTVMLSDGETMLRLVDDAFVKICSAVNDLSMQVRAYACGLLGSTKLVSEKFLQQTLDKQLMSNMKKKRTAHERGEALVRSGEWASGRRWADDAPRETLDARAVSLMAGGAAGAFVHGLEDEFMEVRTAAVDAVCELSLANGPFAATCLDFLVDMFNDEIEDVRLRAIDSLTRISHHIVLREDQLETILGALEDFSMDVREGLHRMLGSCSLASKTCLEMCIDKILENLKRYPQDKRSTYRCAQRVGAAHAALTLPLVPRLLAIHPFFDMPQPDVDDPAYICVLILVFNAAQHCSSMLQLFEEHTTKHYSYLRDTMPQLVPHLPIGDALTRPASSISELSSSSPSDERTIERFLDSVMQHVDNPSLSTRVRLQMMKSAEEQLTRLAEMEPSVSGACKFTALFIRSSLALAAALGDAGADGAPPSMHAVDQLRENCLRLQHQFSHTTPQEMAAARQLALRAAALRLCAATARGAPSALPAAHALSNQAESLDRYLADVGVDPDSFTISVFQQVSLLAEPKPGPLARVILPLLQVAALPKIPRPNLKITMCVARIISPAGETDSVTKFAAGLVTRVALEAEVMGACGALRVCAAYPDGRTQLAVPPPADVRKLEDGSDSSANVRVLTRVLISHQVWTEPCAVELSLCLAVAEEARGEAALLQLCKPVKVTVAPKPIKRGI